MNKLLKSVRSVTNNKDDILKKSIISQLSDSCKEIHYTNVEENKSPKNNEFSITEAANNLCSNIEAIFLHGLRDTLTHRFKKALADVAEQPEPSFWPPLLVISHRQIIDQIINLSQITTEVGQCRAWIRLALNDCLLSSYLMTIRQDSSSLKSYYRVNAFIRDGELLDVAQRLIEGVETFKTITLPVNSSLLNTWPLPSLILAGIWAPTLKSCPVAPCDDVAQAIAITESTKSTNFDNSSDTASVCSGLSFNSQSSGFRQIVALTEDEVLKIILAKDKDILTKTSNSQSIDDIKSSCSSDQERNNDFDVNSSSVGNSLNKRSGWSFNEDQYTENKHDVRTDSETKRNENEPQSMDTSFNALIESYNLLSGAFIKTPDIRDVWQKFEDERKETEVVKVLQEQPIIVVAGTPKIEASMAAQIGKIAKEKGLDVQNYECIDCKQPLGIANKPKVCAFTGEYFCDNCMNTEDVQIPARIIHNWDFKAYAISRRGMNYLNQVKDHPIIDFKVLNPHIYGVVGEMAVLQILRTQLNFLRAYLFTCREPVIEELQKQMWPREYMYEHIHQYSLLDLSDVMSGLLAQQLEKVVIFGKEHVYGCWLCSQKGFVCELCNKPKPLFPFETENVYRCDECSGVYHKSCLNSGRPCPKCKRRKKREELPLLGAITID